MKLKLSLFLAFCFFVQGLITLPQYGMNWDEPIHYLRGQAYLHFFLTGKKDYSDLPKLRFHYPEFYGVTLPTNIQHVSGAIFNRSYFQNDTGGPGGENTYDYLMKHDAGHPPTSDILASFSNYIFYQKLGIIGDIEGYHAYIIFVSTLMVAAVFLFCSTEFGMFAGLISLLSLILYPLFFSESHFNIKDPVQASFYTLTLISFYYAIVRNNWKWLLASALIAGFALGTKLNIAFAFFILLIWILILKWNLIKKMKWPFSKSFTLLFIAYPLIAIANEYAFWPYLWQNPKNILNILSFYQEIGTTVYQPSNYFIFGFFNTYASQWILFTTPIVTLFFTFFGILYCFLFFSKEKNKTSLFILLWFLIPITRVSAPNAGIYGGVRQIMEYIPAMALLSGIGAAYIVQNAKCKIQKFNSKFKIFNFKLQLLTFIFEFLIILLFIPITLKLISIHPNENVYFNSLIGGLKGAQDKNFANWGTTLGSDYRQGINWINTHAEYNANVALVNGLSSNIPKTWFRPDINFFEGYYSGSAKKGEYLMEVVDQQWNKVTPKEKRDYVATLVSVYEVKVDGVSILAIWKNDRYHTK